MTLLLVVTVTCPARATHTASNAQVWTEFVNSSGGWPDGVSFIIGLTTPQFMFLGLDGALHMAEECIDPVKTVPRALMATISIGTLTAFGFAVSMAYCLTDVETILSAPGG